MPSVTLSPPATYTRPRFPSLYWPIRAPLSTPRYLYYTIDILRYTLYWTLIFFGAVHLATSAWAVAMVLRSAFCPTGPKSRSSAGWKTRGVRSELRATLGYAWAIPVIMVVVGAVEALLAGSVVGAILGAIYSAGYYKMSTWTPFLWGLINVLVLVLSSFSIHGGL